MIDRNRSLVCSLLARGISLVKIGMPLEHFGSIRGSEIAHRDRSREAKNRAVSRQYVQRPSSSGLPDSRFAHDNSPRGQYAPRNRCRAT